MYRFGSWLIDAAASSCGLYIIVFYYSTSSLSIFCFTNILQLILCRFVVLFFIFPRICLGQELGLLTLLRNDRTWRLTFDQHSGTLLSYTLAGHEQKLESNCVHEASHSASVYGNSVSWLISSLLFVGIQTGEHFAFLTYRSQVNPKFHHCIYSTYHRGILA